MPVDARITQFLFEVHTIAPETFTVVEFKGEESIARPFHFEITLASEDPAVAFSKVINAAATLTLMHQDTRIPIEGIVADFHQMGHDARHCFYRAVLAPPLWLLSLTYQSRIFQHKTVQTIIQEVLEEAGLHDAHFRFDLTETYPKREYCVQYKETNLNFISRLMEFEGMFYYFDHDDQNRLVITDHQQNRPLIGRDPALRYHPDSGLLDDDAGVDVMRSFTCRERLVTGRVKLNDYNYETPEADLRVESEVSRDMPGVHYEYGLHYKDQREGERLAQIRQQEIACQRRVLYGRSHCPSARPGYVFTLEGHFRRDLDEDYFVTRVIHQGRQHGAIEHLTNGRGGAKDRDDEGVVYHNDLTCIPATTAYRAPRRTPTPRIPGIMTAQVESRGGDYPHIDEHGRYQARMHFDLGDAPEAAASKPIRMNQPYAGPGYGIHFPSHADAEMIWACVDGNPDRPLALGAAPNPSQHSPVFSELKEWNTIRSWAGNELSFIDTVGEEVIQMIAMKDYNFTAMNNRYIHVGNDLETYIKRHEKRLIEEGNRDVVLQQGDESLLVEKGSLNYEIKSGDVSITSLSGGCGISSKDGKIACSDSITLECGGSSIVMSPASIRLEAPGCSITLAAGNIILEASAAAFVNGGAMVEIKGGVVNINP